MNFSKTTEYALQIMSLMAQDETKLYRTEDIFKKLNIPFRYLRKLMTNLAKSNLIISEQGKFGGYRFSRQLDKITLLDIITASGDTSLSEGCFFGIGNCTLVHKCIMHDKWVAIRDNIKLVLTTTTLAEIKNNVPVNISPGINNINI